MGCLMASFLWATVGNGSPTGRPRGTDPGGGRGDSGVGPVRTTRRRFRGAEGIPDPPAVGHCALSAPARDGGGFGEPSDLAVTAVTWGPCTGPIVGEVVAVQPSDDDSMSPGEDWPDSCYRGAAAFAGLDVSGPYPTLAGAPPTDPVTWAPAVGANIQRVRPDDEERRAGQSWQACLVTPADPGSYRGALEQAFVSGQVPEDLACVGTEQISNSRGT
jgi:hypothetical protein